MNQSSIMYMMIKCKKNKHIFFPTEHAAIKNSFNDNKEYIYSNERGLCTS